jgi:transmembrane 9 superfamily protein 1
MYPKELFLTRIPNPAPPTHTPQPQPHTLNPNPTPSTPLPIPYRYPENKELFCAVLGNGSQLLCMCFGVLFLACLGPYTRYNRGALLVAALLIFALTSGVNGYVAASMYTKLEGKSWVWALMLAYFLFLGPFFVVGTFLNFVAVGYNSSAALPFGTVVVILLILTLVRSARLTPTPNPSNPQS